jgi:hypothetical protein
MKHAPPSIFDCAGEIHLQIFAAAPASPAASAHLKTNIRGVRLAGAAPPSRIQIERDEAGMPAARAVWLLRWRSRMSVHIPRLRLALQKSGATDLPEDWKSYATADPTSSADNTAADF